MKKTALAGLRGLGPKSQAWLHAIGIETPEQLRACDPFEVYARLRDVVPGLSINMLYGLIGAIEDIDWRQVQRERKLAILLRLEAMGLL
ncbi:TfoX/Sxy family DNA transformation protein [Massilia sp. TS11]|uniref:TfoX/Sxy family DNA transformation protein n=1 Tax=Massilia sp. TS11 TaxID=2908003 RepID=UPI001EDB77BE|nr:TfoX/Sxy family DNA transformation protein [Massilia sp. TS11]MCG2585011.1 TfoX/Sxy family protein [Massilia sp. TS11]